MQAACRGGCRKAESPCLKDNGQRCFSMVMGYSEQELKPMTDLEEKAEQVRDCSHHVLNVHARLVFMHVPQAAAANARP